MSTDKEKNNLIYAKKRELLKKSIAENPIYRALSNSLADEGISEDIENFVDRYISILGMENLKNNVAFDEHEISKFIIDAIDSISEEKNGLVLNQDGTKDYKASFEQKMDIIYEGIPDFAREKMAENEQDVHIFILDDISNDENSFFEKLMSGEINSTDTFRNLEYQIDSNAEGVLKRAENNRLGVFIESKDELDLIVMCTQYDSATDPSQKKELLDKICQLPYAQKFMDPKIGEINKEEILDTGRNWRKNYIEGKRKIDLIDYSKLRESGKDFPELSEEDKNRVLRSAIEVFENKDASVETKKVAQAILLDISPVLLETSRDESGNIVSKINDDSLVSLYNSINPDKKLKNASEIREEFAEQDKKLIMQKLEQISKAETLMTYEEWQKINISRDEQISYINESIDIGLEFKDFARNNNDNLDDNIIDDSNKSSQKGLKAFIGKAIQKIAAPVNNLMARLKTQKLPAAKDNEFRVTEGSGNNEQFKKETKDNNPFAVSQDVIENVNRIGKEAFVKANSGVKDSSIPVKSVTNEDKEDFLSID